MNYATKDALQAWLKNLLASHTVIAPKQESGMVLYKPVSSPEEIAWDFERTDLSAKEHFLPMSEALFTLKRGPEGPSLHTPELEKPQVLFAARPCDAQALAVLDALLLQEPADPYYAGRRARTTIVALACSKLHNGCFCTSVGGGPDNRRNSDAMLWEVDGGYAVEALSDKGKALLAGLELQQVDKELPKAEVGETIEIVPSEEWPAAFGDVYWARLSDRCLGCRVCAYDCPTCYCFDVRDVNVDNNTVERLRCWDSCQSSGCYRLAGGHNPRAGKGERLRQRFYHKFMYYPERHGLYLCVGCGRCVVQCPVNIDIREVLADMAEKAPELARK